MEFARGDRSISSQLTQQTISGTKSKDELDCATYQTVHLILDFSTWSSIILIDQKTFMFDNQLRPYYQGRVLMNESALNDPTIIAVLDEMALRNFKDRPRPNAGTWYISDRD